MEYGEASFGHPYSDMMAAILYFSRALTAFSSRNDSRRFEELRIGLMFPDCTDVRETRVGPAIGLTIRFSVTGTMRNSIGPAIGLALHVLDGISLTGD